MKVALVHDFLFKLGGAERVLKVLSEMFPEAPIYTLLYDEEKVGDVFDKRRVRTSFLQKYPKFIRRRYRFLVSKMPRAIEEFDLEEYDLVISSSGAYSHGIITSLKTKHLCYCHSPMRYVWDYTHEYRREHNIRGLKSLLYVPMVKKLREWDSVAKDRPDVYLANSKTVRGRLRKYFRQESSVIYPPVDVDRFEISNKHENFFLIVSTLTPYKKIDLAVELFNKIGRPLKIIGDGPHRKYLEAMAGDNVEFLGFRTDMEVKEQMEKCRALIFPGEEDFGITPIEAMACGKPVLAFAKGGCTETVIAGKTGELFDEQSIDEMEDALARLMHNEKFYDSSEIRKHAERFSREVFERKILKRVDAMIGCE